MSDNYTRPSDENHTDTPQDLLAGVLVFAQALGTIIPVGEAVLIRPKGEASEFFGNSDGLLAIANLENQIKIIPIDDYIDDTSEFTEGMWITISED